MPNRPVPELATGFVTDSEFDRKYPMFSHSYRVEHYYKAVPVRFHKSTEENEVTRNLLNEIFSEMFLKSHPDWHHEYWLHPCRKEEATHVTGVGVGGITVAIDDPEVIFDYTYIGWSDEMIQEHKDNNEHHVLMFEKDPYWCAPYQTVIGEWHD
jgi:hypothetical protein